MVRIQLIDQYGQIVDGINVTVKATRRSLPDIFEWIESAFGGVPPVWPGTQNHCILLTCRIFNFTNW